jgi:lon-related putative ATP-dependent protease
MTNTVKPLKPEDLYTPTDPASFKFETTAELAPLEEIVGQDRAVESVKFAVGMSGDGYNLFALGPEGTGKKSLVESILAEKAAKQPVPSDWCYVNNFDDPHLPQALELPPGKGRPLQADMQGLIIDLRTAIPAAFETEDYRNQKEAIEEQLKKKNEEIFTEFQDRANKANIIMIRTPTGMGLAPVANGEILKPKEFEALSKKEQKRRTTAIEKMQKELEDILHKIPKWEKQSRQQLRDHNRKVTQVVVGHMIEDLKEAWQEIPAVPEYLDAVRDDVVKTAGEFMATDQSPEGMIAGLAPQRQHGEADDTFRRYQVNVMVDNGENPLAEGSSGSTPAGAPVVYEDHPTLPNLIGRIEHMSQFGALLTDFTMIKPGALHRANGGYLILDARKTLLAPFTWETLMRALDSKHIRIESPAEALGWVSTVTLEPEPIPLNVKVMILGEPRLYYLLSRLDPEFRELFKVAADFDNRMDRDESSAHNYARLIATLTKRDDLHTLNRAAVARVVEHGARLAGDSEKLTAHMASIVDLVRESDYWARETGAEVIGPEHITKAIQSREYRSDRIRERIQEEIERGTMLIETDSEVTGQVNALSVIQLDHFSFGRPSRVSCRVRMGKGEVVDIEREVALGGPLHSKGVMILSSYLASRYSKDSRLSLSASLVFEQSYGDIDGDSASSAELYALLSALSGVPIKQSLAVTGSVDQMGRVQAIGGANDKIEGFFDVCQRRGLTGEQGVLIPASNVKHLMLREDVVEAVGKGLFNIYPIETIDQGIEMLTGVEAGTLDEKGVYPLGSVNRAVAKRLKDFAIKAAPINQKK